MTREKGIVRDKRPNGASGWRVRLRIDSVQVSNEFFSDYSYDGSESLSLAAARRHRNQIAQLYGIRIIKKTYTSLYETRIRLELTQSQAADLLDVSLLTYSKIERLQSKFRKGMPELLEFRHQIEKSAPFTPSVVTKVMSDNGKHLCDFARSLGVGSKTVNGWLTGVSIPQSLMSNILLAIHDGMPYDTFFE